ncbi:MAG: hypothetical protein ACO1RT_17050, partial [Planctomycetaceae bacterium]
AIISRLMAKAPDDRFADARQVLMAIDQSTAAVIGTAAIGGTAAATIQLQQAMRAETKRRRKQRWKRIGAASVLLAAAGAGALYAARSPAPSIKRLLALDLVPQKPSVEEQYLAAASRDDVLAWRAVKEYFPASESEKNAAYAFKADLQLARLLGRTDRSEEAKEILTRLVNDPAADRLYQVIALAELITLTGDSSPASKSLWEKLRQSHKAVLANRPEAARILRTIVHPEILARLESA